MEMEHEGHATGLCRCDESRAAVAEGRRSAARALGMSAAASIQSVRLSWAVVAGVCVGAVLTFRTGLLSALPSATGLTVLAASDVATRRIPRNIFAVAAVATVTFAVVDALRLSSTRGLLRGAMVTAVVAVVAAAIWLATTGIAFGDVKLLVLAAFVPGSLRGSAVVAMVLFALLAALTMIVIERIRLGSLALKSTIPFGPPLLVGWLVGVWIA